MDAVHRYIVWEEKIAFDTLMMRHPKLALNVARSLSEYQLQMYSLASSLSEPIIINHNHTTGSMFLKDVSYS